MNNRIFLDLNTSNIAPGGGFVVYKENRITVDECWGNFSNSQSASIDQNTIFDLASITKLYTTAIVMRMHQKSMLDIDDLMSKYLYIYHHSNLKIIDLLTHRANFGIRLGQYREKFGTNFRDKVFDIKPPRRILAMVFFMKISASFT